MPGSLKWYRGLNADIDTIQAKDELDDRGSESPGAGGIPTPKAANYVRRIIACGATDGAAIGNLVLFLRLEGDAMVNDETFMLDGFTIPVATGTGNIAPADPSEILNFPINGGSRLQIFGDSEGDAESNFELGVCLELAAVKEAPLVNEGAEIRTRTFAADVDGVDSVVDATGSQGSNAKPNNEVPADVEVLSFMRVAWGVDEGADGAGVLLVRLKGDWLSPNPQVVYAIAKGNVAGQSGSDETAHVGHMTLGDMNLEVFPGTLIEMDFEMAGSDLGSGVAGITLGFA